MDRKIGNYFSIFVFLFFLVLYIFFLKYVCMDETKNTFDLVQGTHVFDIDDTYRLFLSQRPFSSYGLWLWNFILPVNIAYDGFISWVTNKNIYLMRSSHLVAVLASLYLVYLAGRKVGISTAWMLASCFLLLSMPLYALLSMSFYGESILAALMGLVIYALVMRRERLLIAAISLMPLTRPEGIFFLGAMVFVRLRERNFVSAGFMLLPGIIYFFFLMYFFNFSINNYFGWRNALSSQYSLIPSDELVMGYGLMPFYTLNPLWWVVGLVAAWLAPLRQLRPMFVAALLLIAYWAVHCFILRDARGEARYYYAIFPLLAVSFAAGVQAFSGLFPKNRRWHANSACGFFILFICVENMGQIDQIRANIFSDRRWPLAGEPGAVQAFYLEPSDIREWRNTTARFIEAYTQYDRSIKKVIVNAYPVFSSIDASQLPEGLDVEYSPMAPKSTRDYFYGYFFTMFPRLPQYTFYRFLPAQGGANDGHNYALYVGPLFNGVHAPIFANPVFQVYKVSYQSTQYPMQRMPLGWEAR